MVQKIVRTPNFVFLLKNNVATVIVWLSVNCSEHESGKLAIPTV